MAATSYNVLRGTIAGGPYLMIGNTTTTRFSDRAGLVSGGTYYYTLQPLNAVGEAICQSNEARIKIPNAR
jgi:hypothetical protein